MPLFFNDDPDEHLLQVNGSFPLTELARVCDEKLSWKEQGIWSAVSEAPPSRATALGGAADITSALPYRLVAFYSAPALVIVKSTEVTKQELTRFRKLMAHG